MFYLPVEDERYFTKKKRYSQIEWAKFSKVVDAFGKRIGGWYLQPGKALRKKWDYSFSLMAINCLLVDCFSEYELGKPGKSTFKTWAKDNIPGFTTALIPTIKTDNSQQPELFDIADVFYHGFRCGILHDAHTPLYCGLSPQPNIFKVDPSKETMYADKSACPTVHIDLQVLFDHLLD